MAQISVLDGAGDPQTVAKVVNTGSAADADSLPVASSTEDKAVRAAAAASLAVMDDWDESDRAKVNPIAGQAGVAAGAGAVSALVQRITLASDDPLVVLAGVKTTSVTALETGGVGIIGWLSQIWRDIKGGIVLQAGTNNIGDVDVLTLPDYMQPFIPEIAPTTDTAATANEDVSISGSGTAMWVANISTTEGEIIDFVFGTSAGDATTGARHRIFPGTFGTLRIPTGTTHMAFASLAGTPSFMYMRGNGSV
jgi:hypothetical protein